jgi:hypothetical protein
MEGAQGARPQGAGCLRIRLCVHALLQRVVRQLERVQLNARPAVVCHKEQAQHARAAGVLRRVGLGEDTGVSHEVVAERRSCLHINHVCGEA